MKNPTTTQAEFINGVLDLIVLNPKLFYMFTLKGTGKTTAIEMISTILEQKDLETELKQRQRNNMKAGILKTTPVVLSEFSVAFRDRYFSQKDHLSHSVVESLIRGANPHSVIENLVEVVDRAQELNHHLTMKSKLTPLIIPDQNIEP